MGTMQRGEKTRLSALTAQTRLDVGVHVAGPQTVDISAFGLDADERLSDDRYFVFYNQPSSPCGSIALAGARDGADESFRIDLAGLPATIKRIVVVATIDGAGDMSGIGPSWLVAMGHV